MVFFLLFLAWNNSETNRNIPTEQKNKSKAFLWNSWSVRNMFKWFQVFLKECLAFCLWKIATLQLLKCYRALQSIFGSLNPVIMCHSLSGLSENVALKQCLPSRLWLSTHFFLTDSTFWKVLFNSFHYNLKKILQILWWIIS